MRAAVLICLGALLGFPAGASAGVAFAEETDEYAVFVEFDGYDGEANDLTVTPSGSRIVYHDSAVPMDAGQMCESVDPHTVSCPVGDVVDAWTHDGDDVIRLAFPAARRFPDVGAISGGGDDTIIGSSALTETMQGESGDDVLLGGPGHDVMFGGRGDDVVSGGPGHDRLWGDYGSKRGRDAIAGGPGRDTVWYGERRRPVTVDLRRTGGQGAPGEGDTITDVEGAAGGDGEDRLIGNAEDNVLIGRGGRDLFECGGGADVVRSVSPHARVTPACEAVRTRGLEVETAMEREGPDELLVPVVQRHRRFGSPFCRAVVQLAGPFPPGADEPYSPMGTGVVRAPLGERAVVHVRLTERGREVLARPGRVMVLVSVRGDPDCDGVPPEVHGGFTLAL